MTHFVGGLQSDAYSFGLILLYLCSFKKFTVVQRQQMSKQQLNEKI